MRLSRLFAARKKPAADFVLQSYTRPDGSFDYQRYRNVQEAGNKQKLSRSWATAENIACAAEYIRGKIPRPEFGLCHGTRRGLEQQWFRERLGCEVIGTEISETATQFPHTIQWDFHEVKTEWLGQADFIYSNAFDHSYDPALCINRWMSCLKPHGLCVIEHSSAHGPQGASELDPFGATLSVMPYLILKWSKGRFCVQDIVDAPEAKGSITDLKFLMIRHTS